jgi:uncharacterized paraquat-inducible protein A
MRPDEEPEDTRGGDPACWANRVCPECGRLNTGPGSGGDEAETCERCGAELPE